MKHLVLALLCATPFTHAAPPPAKDVSALLAPIIQKHNVPGIAAAVVRTRGKGDKIATTDVFHLGSDTKAMTAMLCGILVDEGKLKWGQTPPFPLCEFRRVVGKSEVFACPYRANSTASGLAFS